MQKFKKYSYYFLLTLIIFLFLQYHYASYLNCLIWLLPILVLICYSSPRYLALKHLRLLAEQVNACLLDIDYPDQIYLYERRIHQQKKQYLITVYELPALGIREKLNSIFNANLALAQLRLRVTDYKVLNVWANELKQLNILMSVILKRIAKKKNIAEYEAKLSQLINQFEASYERIIVVAARDPLVFLLFIDDLKRWQEAVFDYAAWGEVGV